MFKNCDRLVIQYNNCFKSAVADKWNGVYEIIQAIPFSRQRKGGFHFLVFSIRIIRLSIASFNSGHKVYLPTAVVKVIYHRKQCDFSLLIKKQGSFNCCRTVLLIVK
jgi:hypothetical protein